MCIRDREEVAGEEAGEECAAESEGLDGRYTYDNDVDAQYYCQVRIECCRLVGVTPSG